jgi:hypothetical protein
MWTRLPSKGRRVNHTIGAGLSTYGLEATVPHLPGYTNGSVGVLTAAVDR